MNRMAGMMKQQGNRLQRVARKTHHAELRVDGTLVVCDIARRMPTEPHLRRPVPHHKATVEGHAVLDARRDTHTHGLHVLQRPTNRLQRTFNRNRMILVISAL